MFIPPCELPTITGPYSKDNKKCSCFTMRIFKCDNKLISGNIELKLHVDKQIL
jgi:hypothetical protein